jgi:hypothetical protein
MPHASYLRGSVYWWKQTPPEFVLEAGHAAISEGHNQVRGGDEMWLGLW